MTRRVHLIFSPALLTQPILYNLSHQFPVVPNIRRADTKATVGWVDVELHGANDAVMAAMTHLTTQGVEVHPIEMTFME